MNDPDIAVILQAAGNSTRYGSNKLLSTMEDCRPMVCSILDAARAQHACRLILVTQYEEIAALAPDFHVVMNHHPELGIYPALVMLGFAVLLGFYFRHYFFLENTVQRWYRLLDEMESTIKE